jgi:hypothetical protein
VRRWAIWSIYAALAIEIVGVVVFAVIYDALDFHIYRLGGQVIGDGKHLYLEQLDAHWFTYPPFAAVLFKPIAALPMVFSRVLWELSSVAAFVTSTVMVLKLAGFRGSRTAMAGIVAAGILLEPVWHTLFLGQINLILLNLILADIWLLSRGRPAGIGVGIAAAIKLTPAIFVVLFLLAGRTKAALTASATFVLCVLLGWLIAPDASRLYWLHIFYDTRRVGAPYISNQSPFGAAIRILGGRDAVGDWYLLVPLMLAVAGLAIGSVFARKGDWLAAAAATGTTGLLVSPISWTHHWVWIVPSLAVLVRDGRRWPALGGYLLFVLAPPWWTPHSGGPREYGWHGWLTPVANSYLIAGLSFLSYLGWQAWLTRTSGTSGTSGTMSIGDADRVPDGFRPVERGQHAATPVRG